MQWVLFSQLGYKSSFVSDADTKRSWVVFRQKYMQRQRITSFGQRKCMRSSTKDINNMKQNRIWILLNIIADSVFGFIFCSMVAANTNRMFRCPVVLLVKKDQMFQCSVVVLVQNYRMLNVPWYFDRPTYQIT